MFSSLFIVLLFYPSSHLSPSISLLPFSFIFRTRRSIAIILRFSCGYPRCHTVLRVSSVNILRLPIPWSRICFSLPLPSIFECIVDPSAHRSKVSLINRNRKEESIRGSTWKQLCLCSTTFMYKDIVRFSLRSDYTWPFSSFFFFLSQRDLYVCVCISWVDSDVRVRVFFLFLFYLFFSSFFCFCFFFLIFFSNHDAFSRLSALTGTNDFTEWRRQLRTPRAYCAVHRNRVQSVILIFSEVHENALHCVIRCAALNIARFLFFL